MISNILILLIFVLTEASFIAAYVAILRVAPLAAIIFATLFFGLLMLVVCVPMVIVLADIYRRLTLRTVRENGRTVWVWTALNGRKHRSDTDPRPEWDTLPDDPGGKWGY
ncbi:MAG: hypothetical protein ACK4GM_11180 [Tabrizicola sp.]